MKKLFFLMGIISFFAITVLPLRALVNQKLNHPLLPGQKVANSPLFTSADRIVYGVNENVINEYVGLFSVDFRLGPSSVTNLNGLMIPGGSIVDFLMSSNGNQVVFKAFKDSLNSFELYSVPTVGGPTIKLNGPFAPSQDVLDFLISPDSSRVVYRADQDVNSLFELYSVPITGGPATKLNGPMMGDAQAEFRVSPNSSRIVYLADQDVSGLYELYSVPLTGGNVIKLNAPLVFNGDVLGDDASGPGFAISPDSSSVIYRADQEINTFYELYVVPITGGLVTKLNDATVTNVANFQISPNSSRVVYRSVISTNLFGSGNLYSVPMMGGASIKIGTAVLPFVISPDGNRVLYNGDTNNNSTFELYSVPMLGGSAVKLNGPILPSPLFLPCVISLDSSRVIFNTDQTTDDVFELYSIPIAGGPTTKLNGPLVSSGDVLTGFKISPDGQRVIYRADQDTNNVIELYSVPILGGNITKLNGPLVAGGLVYPISPIPYVHPAGGPIIYVAEQDTDNVRELYVTFNPPIITSPTNAVTWVGSNFNYTITADNGPILGWGVSNLPVWASFNSNVISGVPDMVSTNFITLSATNVDGVGSAILRLIVNPTNGGTNNMLPPVITSALNVTSVVGDNFQYTITADNGPITSFGAANLPNWASLNNDIISGVPSAAGMFAINLFATNAAGFDSKMLNLTINPVITNPPPQTNNIPNSIVEFTGDFDGDGTLDLLAQKKKKVTLITFPASGVDTTKNLILGKKDKVAAANVINSNNALIVKNKTVVKAVLVDSNFAVIKTMTLGNLTSPKIKVKASGDVNGDGLTDIITQQRKVIGALLSPNYNAVTLVNTKSAAPKVVGVLARIGDNGDAVSSLLLAKGKKLFFYDIPTNVPFIVGEENEPQVRPVFDKKYKVRGVVAGTNVATAKLIISKGKKIGIINYGTTTLGVPVFKTTRKLGKIVGPK
ncbi:MAG: hypothetical protein K1X66_09185 [Verrucomicrobiae bacterium]|nr:hypothetical protein [Verrucomicrobiae bacterium]